jgi:hypothetical protein
MAKSRDEIQQLGFWDAEVGDPRRGPLHDEICFWAQDRSLDIARHVHQNFFDRGWLRCDIRDSGDYPETIREFCEKTKRPAPKIVKTSLETVLQTRSGYQGAYVKIIGYADLIIEIERPVVDELSKGAVAVGWDSSLDGRKTANILIEAKSSIPILGDLLRQLNLYKTAFSGEVVVVSPDDRYAQKIREQGFHFVRHGD